MTQSIDKFDETLSKSIGLAGKYKRWVQENATVVGERSEAINRDCATLETELKRLQDAGKRRMCVGVFGASQAGKTYLINSMASKPGKQLKAVVGNDSVPFIGCMNPASRDEETTGVATRFTTKNTSHDEEYPIQIELFSELDVAKILCNAYFCDLDDGVQNIITADDIEQAIAGQTFRDEADECNLGYDLLNYLEKTLSSSIYEKYFQEFPRYIRKISKILEDGDLNTRVKIYSLFWGQDKYFTMIFNNLASALERLGNTDTCYSNLSVFENDNVLMVNALSSILDGSESVSKIKSKDGRIVEIDHSTLSALIAELHVVIKNPSSDLFDRADLLDFPGARTREECDQITKSNAGKLLIRGKVAYLFDRYLARRELTSMLLCIGDSTQEVGNLPQLVEKWVNLTHGSTAESRSKMETGLFVVLTKADLLFQKPVSGAADLIKSRFNASFEKFTGSGDDDKDQLEGKVSWRAEWSPRKPFNNTFWLRNSGMATNGIKNEGDDKTASFQETDFDPSYTPLWDALTQAINSSPEANKLFAEPTRAWEEMMKLNDGGRSYLLGQVEKLCHPNFKLAQLEREYLEYEEKASNLLREFFADGDLERIYNERLTAARSVAQPYLQECGKQHKFGEFLDVCYITEADVKAILRKLERGEYGDDHSYVSDDDGEGIWIEDAFGAIGNTHDTSAAPLEKSLEANDKFADLVFSHWCEILDEALKNPEVLNYFPIPQEKLSLLFDEMREGAKRDGIPDKIAEKARNASIFPRASEKMIPHKARLATQIINEFVNRLGVEKTAVTLAAGTKIFTRPVVQIDEALQLPKKSKNYAFEASFQWAIAFVERTALNARATNGLENVDIAANEQLGSIIKELDHLGA